MAEYTEICKAFNRMCNSNEICSNCPMNKARNSAYTCRHWMLCVDPEAAEKVIMKWNKENPVKTNNDKFKEIFGDEPYTITAFDDDFISWLSKEYKEPIKED